MQIYHSNYNKDDHVYSFTFTAIVGLVMVDFAPLYRSGIPPVQSFWTAARPGHIHNTDTRGVRQAFREAQLAYAVYVIISIEITHNITAREVMVLEFQPNSTCKWIRCSWLKLQWLKLRRIGDYPVSERNGFWWEVGGEGLLHHVFSNPNNFLDIRCGIKVLVCVRLYRSFRAHGYGIKYRIVCSHGGISRQNKLTDHPLPWVGSS